MTLADYAHRIALLAPAPVPECGSHITPKPAALPPGETVVLAETFEAFDAVLHTVFDRPEPAVTPFAALIAEAQAEAAA